MTNKVSFYAQDKASGEVQSVEVDLDSLGTWGEIQGNLSDQTDLTEALNTKLESVSESDVTQHQSALTITESQISDLQNYLTTETDPTVSAAIKAITATQISNWDTGYNRSPTSLSFAANTLTLARQDVVDLTVDLSALSDSAVWGEIGGTLSDQTDLQTALNAKADIADNETITGNWTFATPLTVDGTGNVQLILDRSSNLYSVTHDGTNITYSSASQPHVFEIGASTSGTINSTGFSGDGSQLTGIDTDQVTEGASLYFTDARAVTAIKADPAWNATDWDTAFGWGDHGAVGYLVDLTGQTTSDLAEGTNLYYTTARAQADIDKAHVDSLNVDADTLDGLNSLQFLRSDVDDSYTGTITNNGELHSFASSVGDVTKIRFGRSSAQYCSFFGDAGGNYFTSVSGAGNPKSNVKFGYSIDDGATLDAEWTLNGSSGTIWHSGNDGSGSGLDADTVDNLQASQFLRSDSNNSVVSVSNINFANQEATDLNNDGDLIWDLSDGLYNQRSSNAYRIWDSGNDGSGSGLNADLLDGIHGGGYLRSNADDTASGQLTFTGNIGVGTASPNTSYSIHANGDAYGIWAYGSTMGGRFEDSNSDAQVYCAYDGRDILANGTGRIDATSQMRAPIFYDSNNTSFFFHGDSTGDSIRVAGDVVAFYSDERLKTKTGNIVNALDKINSLEAFTYTQNELADKYGYSDNKPRLGLSAQQVQKIAPEVVGLAPFDTNIDEETGEYSSKSGENYLTVDYARMVPLLVAAIKEQNQTIQNLTDRIEQLEKT